MKSPSTPLLSRVLHRAVLCLSLSLATPGLQALSQAPQPDDTVTGIVRLLQARHFEEAVAASERAITRMPNDPRLWTLKAIALSSARPTIPAPAIAAFEQALTIAPDFLPALEGEAQLLYLQGGTQARPALERLLALQPADPTGNAMMGVLEYRAGAFAAAVDHFQAAGALLQSQPASLLYYAVSLARLDRLQQAEPLFAQLLAAQPENGAIRYDLALTQSRSGHGEAALLTLQPLLSATSPDEATLTLAAETEEDRGETQQALLLLRRAMQLHPKEPEAYLDFANLSYAHVSVQVGLDILDAGLKQIPASAQLHLAHGVLNAQLGHNDEATHDFETANRLDPKLSFTRVAMGVAQSQQHQSKEALASFRAAAQAHPEDALTNYLLAEALSAGNYQEGSAEMKEEEAAGLRATKADPSLLAAHDLLATIYLRQGDTAHALAQSDAALAVDPNDQEALYHLVLALRKTGQKQRLGEMVQRLMIARESAAKGGAKSQPSGYLVEAP